MFFSGAVVSGDRCTGADKELMDEKIAFLAKVRPHPNIVKFLGSYDSGNDEGKFPPHDVPLYESQFLS